MIRSMKKKLNVFTFLIFTYSVVVCLTCNRDFSTPENSTSVVKKDIVMPVNPGVHSDQLKAVSATSMRTSRN